MAAQILATVDLTDPDTTERVLASAVTQVQVLEGALNVLTVVPDLVSGIDYKYAIRGEKHGSAEFDLKKIVQDTLERLNQIVEEQTPDGMPAKTLVRHGTVYEQVLKLADEIKAEQIIIGARSPGLGEFMLGSNSSRVVRHAKCSVNVIRGNSPKK